MTSHQQYLAFPFVPQKADFRVSWAVGPPWLAFGPPPTKDHGSNDGEILLVCATFAIMRSKVTNVTRSHARRHHLLEVQVVVGLGSPHHHCSQNIHYGQATSTPSGSGGTTSHSSTTTAVTLGIVPVFSSPLCTAHTRAWKALAVSLTFLLCRRR